MKCTHPTATRKKIDSHQDAKRTVITLLCTLCGAKRIDLHGPSGVSEGTWRR